MFLALSKKVDKSLSIINKMLEISSNPYLSLSFGKDSLVMLHLVRILYKDIPCLFLKSEESQLLYDYADIIDYYEAIGVNVNIVEMNHLNYNFEGGANNEFTQDDFFGKWDGIFMGLRIEESNARRITLIRKSNNEVYSRIMRYSSGARKDMLRCCPIADWSAFDVFSYAKEMDIKLLDVYTDESIRTSAQLNYSMNLCSQLAQLKQRNFEYHTILLNKIPELRFYL